MRKGCPRGPLANFVQDGQYGVAARNPFTRKGRSNLLYHRKQQKYI